ncbi:MAG: response regulator [Pirellulaceae bacterium]|nr:response regulator [Pirellulaceae bacterium]
MAIDNARLYQEGQQANLAKTEFIANMSHEIRTPMTAVLGYADLLLARENESEKIKFLQTIQRNGQFLLEIINDILDLSKIESGKMEVFREDCDVAEVVTDVHSMMLGRAEAKKLRFEVRFDGKLPRTIQSDAKRLRQVLVNLLGNAIKFTESGSIQLIVREVTNESDSRIEFVVNDTGIGIDQEQSTRLFQPFDQGDASVTRKYGGTGLGLAISQRIAGLLGGGISFVSRVGQGSQFKFVVAAGDITDVERIDPSERTDTPSVDPPATQESGQQLDCKVLVVDDRRDVRFLAGHILRNHGATVEFCEDGLEACEFIESAMDSGQLPDLILLDMQMPRLDGYQAAARLRKLGFQNPIVALTADAMHGDMTRCIQSGCDDYLSKPIDTSELLQTVARFTATSAP